MRTLITKTSSDEKYDWEEKENVLFPGSWRFQYSYKRGLETTQVLEIFRNEMCVMVLVTVKMWCSHKINKL